MTVELKKFELLKILKCLKSRVFKLKSLKTYVFKNFINSLIGLFLDEIVNLLTLK